MKSADSDPDPTGASLAGDSRSKIEAADAGSLLRSNRARWLLAAASLGALLGLDFSRPSERQWSGATVLWAIDGYQRSLSPRLASAGARCRFTPTCSHYAEAVIRDRGILVGGVRAAWRIARCGPWTAAGTYDPPVSGALDSGNKGAEDAL